ncbi:MAG: PepSY-associated TM helix domain-containing protein [Veillonellales bacterium]
MKLQTIRKLHLWLGLFFSVFLLVEAVTGLLLSEPRLLGENQPKMRVEAGKQQHLAAAAGNGGQKLQNQPRGQGQHSDSLYHTMKTFHTGNFDNMNLKWLVDLTAIALIILAATGVYFSVILLRAGSRK